MVTIGEYVTYRVTVALPEGTTMLPEVVISFPTTNGPIAVVNVSLGSASNMVPLAFSSLLSDTNGDGIKDTATAFFASLLNQPDNVRDVNDNITIDVVGHVLPGAGVGGQLIVNSVLSYENGTQTFTETTRSVSLTVGQPVLSWSVTWNASSADAGDVLGCTIVFYHNSASPTVAYNLNVIAQFGQAISLNPSSVVSSDPTTTFVRGSDPSWIGLAQLPLLNATANATITFSVSLSVDVPTASTLTNMIIANYSASANGGGKLYL